MNVSKVRIGGIVYDVLEVENLLDDSKATKINGQIKYNTTEILIEKNLSEQAKEVTLWHEIIHGIIIQASMEQEEKLIEVLGYGIFGVLQDNPDILDF